MRNIERNVSLKCSVCGNDQFSPMDEGLLNLSDAPDETEVKCSDCGRVVTKGQLLEENSELIEANIEDIKEEAIKELEKELKSWFK